MTYSEALEYLHSYGRLSPTVDLHRIKTLLEGLGNPQNHLKFLHIAGTNGKGSTAAFCASALQEAGYKTGLFISPYVVRFTERIQINGKYIPEELFAAVMEKVKEVAEADPDNYVEFELLTAAAMEWFFRNGCDIVVLEAGIGGRLDATNAVMTTVVSVITSVSFDHTELLGDTLEKIALEKAQIIKSGGSVVVYPEQAEEVFAAIRETAEKKRAEVIIPDLMRLRRREHFFTYKNNDYVITLRGAHQTLNAVTAIEALDELACSGFYKLTREKIALGLMKATMPARFETVSVKPPVVLDGAHNPSGMESLAALLKSEFGGVRVTAVVAMMKDKNAAESLKHLAGVVNKAVAVKVDNPRCMEAEDLRELLAGLGVEASAAPSVAEAVEAARGDPETGAVIVCGSLYLVSEARKIFKADK
ncbi:MAG: bifunctional folylpolyglutamate synthase/dihydrofolate synthase [Clostridia bacterium]|nr:bifunctional folylpolyglutamate synthase/dihydrofolate synthase [Clostridia bacterium]